jgi:IclR family transcriptional regulator, pca regulon regulatory protein
MVRRTAGSEKARSRPANPKSSVQSLGKAFRLLEAIAASDEDMTLSQIALASGLDPGTTHRMLNTMIDLGYVDRLEGRRFALSLKVLDLGFRAIGRRDIRSVARPILRSLVGEVSEAASLGVLSGCDVLYVERMRAGITRLGVDIRIGTLIPAASSVIGWAMLAFLPKDELDRLLLLKSRQQEFRDVTKLPDLGKRLAEVRKLGYALSASRVTQGLVVLALPVRDEDGYPLAAVSVAAPSLRMNETELKSRALVSVENAARSIARGISASGGTVAA